MMNTHHRLFKVISSLLILTFSFSFILPPNTSFAHHWDEHGQQQLPPTDSEPPPEDSDSPPEPPNDNDPESDNIDPMYLHSGEFVLNRKDISIPSRGMPIEISFTYRSQKTSNLRWGYGWFMNYDYKLKELHTNDIIILDGTGRVDQYTYSESDASYISPAGIYSQLVQNPDGSFTLTQKDKTQYNFDLNGNLTSIVDRNQNALSFTYAEEGLLPIIGSSEYFTTQTEGVIARSSKLLKITEGSGSFPTPHPERGPEATPRGGVEGPFVRDPSIRPSGSLRVSPDRKNSPGAQITDTVERELQFSYDEDGRLSSITDSTGRIWKYRINERGDLKKITTPSTEEYPQGLTTTYTYTKHNLETITDPKGQTYLVNIYDEEDRLSSQEYGNNGPAYINYDEENQTTTITDRKGYITEYKYDNNGNISQKTVYTANLRETDPDYYQTIYEHNFNMERTKIVYPKGNSIEYTYDANYENLKAWEFNTNGNTEGWSPTHSLSSFTVSGGILKTQITGSDPYMYGPDNINITADNSQVIEIRYKINKGDTAQVYWRTSTGSWSADRHIDFNVVSDNEFHTYIVDVGSHPEWTGTIKQIRFDPNTSSGGKVEIDYIRVGSPTSEGNLIEIRRRPSEGSEEQDIVTSFTYEPRFNFVKTITDPKGNITIYTYDYELDPEDPNYGENGNLVNITYPTTDNLTPKTEFTYNQYGQVETITDSNGIVTKYEYYDDTGYLKKITQDYGGLNATTQFTYDDYGNVDTITDANGNITNYDYNALNQLIKVTSAAPFNYITKYSYDKNGNLIQIDRQQDENATTWQTAIYTYTILDQLETISDCCLGNQTSFTYDANGNRNSILDAEGNTTTYVYDERNLLWKTTDALGNTTEYAYDENTNLIKIKDSRLNETNYTYDGFDRLKTTTYADSSTENYSYDANSNLYTKTDAKNQTITYTYDGLNRLDLKTYPDNSTVDYLYDLSSRLTSIENQGSSIGYVYDNLNRVTQTTNYQLLTTSYEYDLVGNRTKLTYPDGDYITYSYDELNRLTSIQDLASSIISSYSYDSLSRRTQLKLANNTQTTYVYDEANRLTSLTNSLPLQIRIGTKQVPTDVILDPSYLREIEPIDRLGSVSLDIHKIISKFSYTYDDVGNRISEDRKHLPAGKAGMSEDRNFTYNYDSVYQLIGVSGDQAPYRTEGSFTGQGQSQEYDYDPVGNRETVRQDEETTTYTTNNLNQYTQTTNYEQSFDFAQDKQTTYSYDANGNLTNDGINTYGYDFENRLTNATVIATPTVMSGEAIYKYDPFGRRIEKNVDGVITRFVYAGDQIIAEYDSDNNLLAKYIYGVGIDEVLKMERDDQTYYYHADGLTSISEITDSSGNVVEKYTYDVYGAPTVKDAEDNILSESAIGNRYMFTAREWDKETNLYHYRARAYNPTIGRFLQRDPLTWGPNDLRIINFHPDYEVVKVLIDSFGLEGTSTEQVLDLLHNIPSLINQVGTSNPSLSHLYLYVGNNPINWVDPWGFGEKDPWWKLTPQRALRWGGRALQEAGMKGLGKTLGLAGLILEEGGIGKITGIAVGGGLGAGVGGLFGGPVGAAAGGIAGGMVGGWFGSWFDSPDAGNVY